MTEGEIIKKLSKYPNYMDTGAGKLGRIWNTDPDLIRKCKKIVIRNRKYNISATKKLPKVLIVDIETSPMRAYVWRRWKQNIHLEQTISEWFMLAWSAKWLYNTNTMSDVLTPKEVKEENDFRIVAKLWELLNEADIVIAHNGNSFDLPKINSRFIMNGLPPTTPYNTIDTKLVSAKQFGFSSNKLDALAGYFGIEHKLDTDFELWANCMNGDVKSLEYMRIYNEKDVEILEEVYLKLRPWIKNHPNISLLNDIDEIQCSCCGSTNIDLIPDKLYYTSVGGYNTFRCNECGGISRGRKTVINKTKNKNTLVSVGK